MTDRDVDRFWSHVDRAEPDECWTWRGYKSKGYGMFCLDGQRVLAHRVAALIAGKIKRARAASVTDNVLHACDNPSCVNANHLRAGTRRENSADAVRRGRTARGEKHGMARLTWDDVRALRRGWVNGSELPDLARAAGITHANAHAIVAGNVWAEPEWSINTAYMERYRRQGLRFLPLGRKMHLTFSLKAL